MSAVSDPVLDVDEAVFDVVEQIPPGRVSTYGAVGRLIGIGPRRVARALSSGGGAVPWYRVGRADGSAAVPVRVRQLELVGAGGVPMRNGRVDVSAVGWPDGGAFLPSAPAVPELSLLRDSIGGWHRGE